MEGGAERGSTGVARRTRFALKARDRGQRGQLARSPEGQDVRCARRRGAETEAMAIGVTPVHDERSCLVGSAHGRCLALPKGVGLCYAVWVVRVPRTRSIRSLAQPVAREGDRRLRLLPSLHTWGSRSVNGQPALRVPRRSLQGDWPCCEKRKTADR